MLKQNIDFLMYTRVRWEDGHHRSSYRYPVVPSNSRSSFSQVKENYAGHLADDTKPKSNRFANCIFRLDFACQLQQTTVIFDPGGEILIITTFQKAKFEIYKFAVHVRLKFIHLRLQIRLWSWIFGLQNSIRIINLQYLGVIFSLNVQFGSFLLSL